MKLIDDIRSKYPTIKIIGEVKPFSPFDSTADPAGFDKIIMQSRLLARLEKHVDILSIHTDQLWWGSYVWLKEARRLAKDKKILAKGFHPTMPHIKACIENGADYVLTVGWHPGQDHKYCWHEPIEKNENSEASVLVFNSRDPRTGEKLSRQFSKIEWFKNHFPEIELVQASNIQCVDDVHPDVDYVLIGTALCS